ncbi:MAG: hypothetical protein JW878_01815 [Methanomicrobia archaeon]|nr:hypothetical protein [Methanomicrobia archaeon]
MSELIKTVGIKRAYLARLYSLCCNLAVNDVSVFIANRNITFGGMSPISSFELSIQTLDRNLDDFFEPSSKERANIQFTVSKDDFSKILAPFSKKGGPEQPKKDTDMVSLEIRESGIRFLQSKFYHESEEIKAKVGYGAWIPLPSEAWEFSVSSDIFSEYIHRMTASGGPTIKFKQEGSTLWVISDAGKEKLPSQASRPRNCEIDVSRMTLMKVKTQLSDYEDAKVGVRDFFLVIEGQWMEGICKWKLEAI